MTLLALSHGRTQVHRSTCPRAGTNAVPWVWAEVHNRVQAGSVAAIYHWAICPTCNPLGALPAPEHHASQNVA